MKIDGLRELEKKFNKLSGVAKKEATQEALNAGAVLVHSSANLLTPVDTGNLRSSLDFEVSSDNATVFTPVIYSEHVEYGTSKMSAQPFVRPALDNNISKLKRLFSAIYAKHLKR